MARPHIPDEIAAVSALCRDIGLGDVAPVLLKAAHHTTLLIPDRAIVARVQSAEPHAVAWPRAAREVAVARHLADRGAPVLGPLAELAGPHLAGASVVTFWPYVAPTRAADARDAALAAALLASVHEGLRDYRDALPSYGDALDRCRVALDRATALSPTDRDVLGAHYRRLRDTVASAGDNQIPLHGDAHLGNALIGGQGALWLDFEDVCLGPREYDIACLPRHAWALVGDVDPALLEVFADLRSVCVAIWCWADIARSPEVREAAEYHLGRVRKLAT